MLECFYCSQSYDLLHDICGLCFFLYLQSTLPPCVIHSRLHHSVLWFSFLFRYRPMLDTDSTLYDLIARLGCSASQSLHAGHRLRPVGLDCCTRRFCCVSLSLHAGHRLRLVGLDCRTRRFCSICVFSHPSPCHASRLGPTLHEDQGSNAKPLGYDGHVNSCVLLATRTFFVSNANNVDHLSVDETLEL